MILIAGLGNPGTRYAKTRHNMGFDAVDILARKYGIGLKTDRFRAKVGTGVIGGEKVLLMKPQTYMNESGTAVSAAVSYYKLDPASQLIVLSDDIALPPGVIRIRKAGSAGGQKGLKDIIAKLGTQDFARIRIGVGAKPEGWDLADHVLSVFSPEERQTVDEALARAAEAAAMIVSDGADAAMNRYNVKPAAKPEEAQ